MADSAGAIIVAVRDTIETQCDGSIEVYARARVKLEKRKLGGSVAVTSRSARSAKSSRIVVLARSS